MKKNNIALIGMPGAGKTYLGKKIAKQFKMNWINLDVVDYNKILKSGNEADYLKCEEKVLLNANGSNNVFSCGGSSIYSKKGMSHLKKISQIIYLQLPFTVIKKRLGNYSDRGIVRSKVMNLTELYKERDLLYKNYADFIINCKNDAIDYQFKKLCELVTAFILLIPSPNGSN